MRHTTLKLTAACLTLLLAFAIRAQVAEDAVAEPFPLPPPDTAAAESTDDATPDTDPAPAARPPAQVPEGLKFHLMDGTVITGKLKTTSIPIDTAFGQLVVPIDAVQQIAPGLTSHPKINQTINTLIQDLGSPQAKTRDQAQSELLAYGPALLPELQRHANDPDAERKVRIANLIEELYSVESDEFAEDTGPELSLLRLDQVVTEQFTVAGKIEKDTFHIQSKFGELVVNLKDIKAVERPTAQAAEVRRRVDVAGTDMTCRAYKKTGIRLNRGDRVIISAEGRITMSPWGSNTVSGPDGIPQNGMYNGQIPMGALAGRIGDSGEEFLVGSKTSFVAKKAGTLQLGFAMQANWANYQFPGTYNARIRVIPSQ